MRWLYWIFKKERKKISQEISWSPVCSFLQMSCTYLLKVVCSFEFTYKICNITYIQVKNTFNTGLTGYFSQLAHSYCTQTFLERPTQHCHYQYKWKWGSAKNTCSLSVYPVLWAASFFPLATCPISLHMFLLFIYLF